MSDQHESQSLYDEGKQANCKTCHKPIVFLNVRHQGMSWIHEDTARPECVFLAEPEELSGTPIDGPGMPELVDNPPISVSESKAKVKNK